ncbi:hypothetical protein TH53_07435 [Pedobacter lusitanus]|uniref:DNA/RNA non-specific endonuclease n=2 Tax=Pedobacter lusitanus TaxID=1503925 RepID=A0A0D0GNV2_9SPHI|nr:hypothetical protein TH53_07435 [Pedobacter lusitanus]
MQPDQTESTPNVLAVNSLSTSADDSNLLLGNPSDAKASSVEGNNYLMDKTYFALSYNSGKGTPNWVSWHIQSSDLGTTDRSDDFRSDADLLSGWYNVKPGSYTNTGFDKGHNCPSGDRTSSKSANSSTFLMSNMIPQAPYNNQQTWKGLEDYSRALVKDGKEVYVICGSYGKGGTGKNGGTTNTIDGGNVTVPANVWKIVVVLADGKKDLTRIDKDTRVIAINTPNQNSIDKDWKKYRTSVADIEKATGYKFFTSVSSTIAAVLKKKVDNLN